MTLLKTYFFIVLTLFVTQQSCNAQPKKTLAGRYYLQSQTEFTSSIYLKKDSTFEFSYSAGILNRKGSGNWKFVDNEIILNSREKPLQDYYLTSQRIAHQYTTFHISIPDPTLLPLFNLTLYFGDNVENFKPDKNGTIKIPKTKIDKVKIVFSQYPERQTELNVTTDHNYFEIKPYNWLSEIFIKEMVLKPTTEGLIGTHPLRDGTDYIYAPKNPN